MVAAAVVAEAPQVHPVPREMLLGDQRAHLETAKEWETARSQRQTRRPRWQRGPRRAGPVCEASARTYVCDCTDLSNLSLPSGFRPMFGALRLLTAAAPRPHQVPTKK